MPEPTIVDFKPRWMRDLSAEDRRILEDCPLTGSIPGPPPPRPMSLPNRPAVPVCVCTMPATPDGFYEVLIECNGVILATRVMPALPSRKEVEWVLAELRAEFMRRC